MADITPKYGIPYPEDGDFITPKSLQDIATSIENIISGQTLVDNGSVTPYSTDWSIFNSILVKQGKIAVIQIVATYLGANPITAPSSGNIQDTIVATLSAQWALDASGPIPALVFRGSGGGALGVLGGALLNTARQISITDMHPPNSTISKNDIINIYGSYALAQA